MKPPYPRWIMLGILADIRALACEGSPMNLFKAIAFKLEKIGSRTNVNILIGLRSVAGKANRSDLRISGLVDPVFQNTSRSNQSGYCQSPMGYQKSSGEGIGRVKNFSSGKKIDDCRKAAEYQYNKEQ